MKTSIKAIACAALLAVSAPALAVPDGLDYQGYLANADGSPVDTTISITFAAYNVDFGGVPLWSQTDSVVVDQGLFQVTLGNPGNAFPAGLFDTPVFIGLFVAGEEMLPRRALSTSPYAFKAADAETLDGNTAADLDQSSEVSALQGDVSGLQGDVSSLGGRVGDLESIGADITAVNAGPGLAGGASSGIATLGVANSGITAVMMAPNSVSGGNIINGAITSADIAVGGVISTNIAANAVGTAQIANGTVTSLDIGTNAVGNDEIINSDNFVFGGVEANGPVNLNGALTVVSGADIRIQDFYNGFRWYSEDGSSQWGAILMRETEASFFDAQRGRFVVTSRPDGIGIGTAAPLAGYTATIPSLVVTGQTNVGLQRVSTTFQTTTEAVCHSHGNLTCYYGTGTVSCPVGTQVLGGGSSGTTPRYGSIARSYPSSTTSWQCAESYDLQNSTRSCYAICGRLE